MTTVHDPRIPGRSRTVDEHRLPDWVAAGWLVDDQGDPEPQPVPDPEPADDPDPDPSDDVDLLDDES